MARCREWRSRERESWDDGRERKEARKRKVESRWEGEPKKKKKGRKKEKSGMAMAVWPTKIAHCFAGAFSL
jgi:hypothetical protein